MVKIAILLVALIGWSAAYTPGTEYRYSYEGRLGLGVPGIQNKVSGAGIKAVVTVQVQDSETAVIKLTNTEVGEYVGNNGISVTNPLPIKYSPVSERAKALEEPFKVYLKKNNNDVMVVPKGDLEWIVNIRKSLAQLFLIEPVRGVTNIEKQKAFTIYEPTIFGRCSVDYVVHQVHHHRQEDRDEQKTKSEPEEEFVMTKAINFDKCEHEDVFLMHSSLHNMTHMKDNIFKNVASRSSFATARLIRKQNNFVIKEESVHGFYSANPFGDPSDKLMSVTNQTLVLEAENKITKRLEVPPPTYSVNSWYMEVASPFEAPKYPSQFVNYYGHKNATTAPFLDVNIVTGIPLDTTHISKMQTVLDKLIGEMATLMLSVGPVPIGEIHPLKTHEGKVTSMLLVASQVISGVDVERLQALFDKYSSDESNIGQMKLKMFLDVCAASGAQTPMKLLLTLMQKQKLTPERITSIFATFTNNFIAVPLIPDLIKYVKTLSLEDHPIMTTNVLANVASLLKKVCVTPETIPHQIFGKHQCDLDIVKDDFIPFLKQMLDKSHESYQQYVIVQSLVNLEVPEVVEVLSKVIQGKYDNEVKEFAILAFMRPEIQENIKKDEIFNLLMPIVENSFEKSVLRQHAISVLVACRPSASWWQRMALLTWKEPSMSVGSFIYYLIRTNYHNTDPQYSLESTVAHFVMPLTKPFPPFTSYTSLYSKYNPEIHSSIFLRTTLMKDDETSVPRDLYTQLITNLGGVRIPILEAAFSTVLSKEYEDKLKERVTQIIHETTTKMSPAPETTTKGEETTTKKTSKDIETTTKASKKGNETTTPSINDKDTAKTNEKVTKTPPRFVRSAENRREEEKKEEKDKQLKHTVREQNTGKVSSLLLKMFENLQFLAPLNPKTVSLPFNHESFNFLKSLKEGEHLQLSKFINPSPMQVFLPTELGIPFFGKMSTPMVQSAEGDVQFGFEGAEKPSFFDLISSQSLTIDLRSNYKFASKVVVDFETLLPWNEKVICSGVESLKSVNLPFKTIVKLETQDHLKNISVTFVPTQEKEFAAVHVHTIPYVAVKSMWPGQLATEYEVFETISVSQDQPLHQNKVPLDKEYTGVDAKVIWQGDVPYPFTMGNFYQQISRPFDLLSLSPSHTAKLSSGTLAVNFANSATKLIQASVAFTLPLFFEEDEPSMTRGKVLNNKKALIMRISTNGGENRLFESSYSKRILSQNGSEKRSELAHKYLQQLPHAKPEAYCMQLQTLQPIFYDLKTLLDHVQSNDMKYSFFGKVKGGSSCQEAQFAAIQGSFKVSDRKKNILTEEITKELNVNQDSIANSVLKFLENPMYDQTNINIDFNQRLPRFFTNMTYRIYDVLCGSQFPHIENNYYNIQNTNGKIMIQGEKYLDDSWNLRVELPKENINLQHFQLPFLYKMKVFFFQDNIFENKNIMEIFASQQKDSEESMEDNDETGDDSGSSFDTTTNEHEDNKENMYEKQTNYNKTPSNESSKEQRENDNEYNGQTKNKDTSINEWKKEQRDNEDESNRKTKDIDTSGNENKRKNNIEYNNFPDTENTFDETNEYHMNKEDFINMRENYVGREGKEKETKYLKYPSTFPKKSFHDETTDYKNNEKDTKDKKKFDNFNNENDSNSYFKRQQYFKPLNFFDDKTSEYHKNDRKINNYDNYFDYSSRNDHEVNKYPKDHIKNKEYSLKFEDKSKDDNAIDSHYMPNYFRYNDNDFIKTQDQRRGFSTDQTNDNRNYFRDNSFFDRNHLVDDDNFGGNALKPKDDQKIFVPKRFEYFGNRNFNDQDKEQSQSKYSGYKNRNYSNKPESEESMHPQRDVFDDIFKSETKNKNFEPKTFHDFRFGDQIDSKESYAKYINADHVKNVENYKKYDFTGTGTDKFENKFRKEHNEYENVLKPKWYTQENNFDSHWRTSNYPPQSDSIFQNSFGTFDYSKEMEPERRGYIGSQNSFDSYKQPNYMQEDNSGTGRYRESDPKRHYNRDWNTFESQNKKDYYPQDRSQDKFQNNMNRKNNNNFDANEDNTYSYYPDARKEQLPNNMQNIFNEKQDRTIFHNAEQKPYLGYNNEKLVSKDLLNKYKEMSYDQRYPKLNIIKSNAFKPQEEEYPKNSYVSSNDQRAESKDYPFSHQVNFDSPFEKKNDIKSLFNKMYF